MDADVRIGDYWYKLAEGVDDSTLGVSFRRFPHTEQWGSLFPQRTNVSGAPGVQNLKSEDLRWQITNFDGGETQVVIDPTTDTSFRAYAESVGIDLSQPGQLQLAHQLKQLGSTGATATTLEGNTFADDVGNSTIVNTTDRELNAVNDRVSHALGALAVGTYQVDWYAYALTATLFTLGSDLTKVGTTGQVQDDVDNSKWLQSVGVKVQTGVFHPTDGASVTVSFSYRQLLKGTAKFTIEVFDTAAGKTVASTDKQIAFDPHSPGRTETATLTFTAHTGKDYHYRVTLTALNDGGRFLVTQIAYAEDNPKAALWELLKAGVAVASGTSDLSSVAASQVIGSTQFVADGASSYAVRLTRSGGPDVPIVLDKVVYQPVTMGNPRLIELGLNNRIWLVDYKASGSPAALYWKEETQAWTAVANLGAPAGAKAIALAHSDNYEFVACDDKIVRRAQLPSTQGQHTQATTDPITGIAVGGNRLLVLTESVTLGTNLYPFPLDGPPSQAPPTAIPCNNAGVNSDLDVCQRMAGTAGGCVFFINQGPDCWVWRYDGTTLAPLAKLPSGFRGRAIVYGDGLTWVGGGFPAVDNNGVTVHRPAVFGIDNSGNQSQLPVELFRTGDAPSRIVAMQLYGSDLWIQAEVVGASPGFRLWRVSLKGVTPAAFLAQSVTVDASQVGGSARGIAVTWQEKALAWSVGAPYIEQTSYLVVGDAYLTTSVYDFNLTEEKRIESIDVLGLFPAGTSIEVAYSADGDPFVTAGVFTASGTVPVSTVDASVFARTLVMRVSLRSSDPTVTPTFYAAGVRAYTTVYSKITELILDTSKANAVRHVDGQAAEGWVGADYLYALADSGRLVEFEDRFWRNDPNNPRILTVAIQNPTRIMFTKGDGATRVELLQR